MHSRAASHLPGNVAPEGRPVVLTTNGTPTALASGVPKLSGIASNPLPAARAVMVTAAVRWAARGLLFLVVSGRVAKVW